MKKAKMRFLVIVALYVFCNGCKSLDYTRANNKLIAVEYYQNENDFVKRDSSALFAEAIFKDTSEYHIRLDAIFNRHDSTIEKIESYPIAIKFQDAYYMNLGYTNEYALRNVFVKLDVVGRYCASIVTDNYPKFIKSAGNSRHSSVWFTNSHFQGKFWQSKNNSLRHILVWDTENQEYDQRWRIKMLSTKNFNEILNSNLSKDDLQRPNFETAIEEIEKKNQVDR